MPKTVILTDHKGNTRAIPTTCSIEHMEGRGVVIRDENDHLKFWIDEADDARAIAVRNALQLYVQHPTRSNHPDWAKLLAHRVEA